MEGERPECQILPRRARRGESHAGAAEASRVMCAVDEQSGRARFVVADVSRDDAWISTDEPDAARLEDWR